MLSPAQVYAEAVITVALMLTIGIISGFITAGITGDTSMSIGGAGAMLVLSGAILIIRLWRLTWMQNSDFPSQEPSAREGP